MTARSVLPLAEQERADLLELLRQLSPAQWEAPTLCTRWRVRDVAIHAVSYDELSATQTAATFLRGGMRVSKVNQIALARYERLDPSGIIDLVDRNKRPKGLAAGFGGRIALTDGTIHHQDIRRALGLPRSIPEERLRPVLAFALRAPTLPSKSNRHGLRLVADDLAWATGSGPEVTGPAEALLMAVSGRPDALDELSGDGLPEFRRRVTEANP